MQQARAGSCGNVRQRGHPNATTVKEEEEASVTAVRGGGCGGFAGVECGGATATAAPQREPGRAVGEANAVAGDSPAANVGAGGEW